MMLAHLLDIIDVALDSGERTADGALILAPHLADYVKSGLRRARQCADELETPDLITFAKAGEPHPCAEIHDLSEIMAREHVSRPTPQVLTEAKLYAFPTVRPVSFDFSQLDNGGDAA